MTRAWRTREELTHEIVVLDKQGEARRAIGRALGVSRNTVRVLLAAHAAGRDTEPVAALPPAPSRAPRPSKLDAFKPRMAELLSRFVDITAQRVFEILKDEGFDGGYTAVKKHVGKVRPPKRSVPSLTTPVYGPGEMSESDWSPYEVRFTTCKKALVQAFSYVLVTSRRKYFGLYETNDLFALMDGHTLAFARFDGCAHECKYDSQKPVVLRWEGHERGLVA